MWDVLVDPALAPRSVDRRQAMVYPAKPAAIVHAPGKSAENARMTWPLRSGEGEYSLTQWAGGNPPLTVGLAPTGSAKWENGVQLIGAQASGDVRPGGTLRWQLIWRVDTLPPSHVDYHWTNQLFDAQGQRVWQKDDVGFPARSWRVGDVVVTDFAAPLAAEVKPGAYQMSVGMYIYPDIKTVSTTDGAGFVQLGPVEIK
jgi:hypothetical protein